MYLDDDLNTGQHLFVSKAGVLLDSWHAAFTSARCVRTVDMAVEPGTSMVWLRLHGDATVAQQISLVRSQIGALPLVVLSDIPSELEALAAFSVAARGYGNTHAGAEVLLNIASVVGQGGLWIGESIMQRLLRQPVLDPSSTLLPAAANNHVSLVDLTEREREVAQVVASGLSNREIATQLGITERTVKAHVGAILEKLQLKSRLQLALFVKNS
jgi:DNA-binding NarL/FixJ family response regulator